MTHYSTAQLWTTPSMNAVDGHFYLISGLKRFHPQYINLASKHHGRIQDMIIGISVAHL